jgi:hypothetical protein
MPGGTIGGTSRNEVVIALGSAAQPFMLVLGRSYHSVNVSSIRAARLG